MTTQKQCFSRNLALNIKKPGISLSSRAHIRRASSFNPKGIELRGEKRYQNDGMTIVTWLQDRPHEGMCPS